MAQMTALQLVQEVREYIAEFDNKVYRDGFSDDPYIGGNTSILNRINRSADKLLPTGYCKCLFSLSLLPDNPDGNEYGLNNGINEFVRVSIDGIALTRVTILSLDTVHAGWNSTINPTQASTPRYYYNYADVIGFWPPPDKEYTAVILADALPNPLSNKTDIPLRLPARYHYLLAVKAALDITIADVENEAAQRRISYLQSEWKEGYALLDDNINSRGDDFDDQIRPMEYRDTYRTN